MTHFNNWSEIPEELQDKINDRLASWTETPKSVVKDWYDNNRKFNWAISQCLINKPAPVEGWFVPRRAIVRGIKFHLFFNNATPLIKNPDGTYSEVKDVND